jgi:glutamate racemase
MSGQGKIGVFDSGLGGLYIASALRAMMPSYDYLYFADTQNLPYGRRSNDVIYKLCRSACEYLFAQGCEIIIFACNTASATALRKLQQDYLVATYPDRRILGVIVPTLESAIEARATRIGLLATQRTVQSGVYETELVKINPSIQLCSISAPLLVPLIEDGGERYLPEVLGDYITPMAPFGVESIILGCTHYVALKHILRAQVGAGVSVISQDEIIPHKTKDYLFRHPEIEARLGKGGGFDVHATDANEIFVKNIESMLNFSCAVREAVIHP